MDETLAPPKKFPDRKSQMKASSDNSAQGKPKTKNSKLKTISDKIF